MLRESENGNSVAFTTAEAPSATAMFPTLTTVEDSNKVQRAIQNSHLEEEMRTQLQTFLFNNADVCTAKVGCTGLLKYQIYLTNPFPICQKLYLVSPPKFKVMKKLCISGQYYCLLEILGTTFYDAQAGRKNFRKNGWSDCSHERVHFSGDL